MILNLLNVTQLKLHCFATITTYILSIYVNMTSSSGFEK